MDQHVHEEGGGRHEPPTPSRLAPIINGEGGALRGSVPGGGGDSCNIASEEVDFTWELSKENVRPLARGRKVGVLKRAFGGPVADVSTRYRDTSVDAASVSGDKSDGQGGRDEGEASRPEGELEGAVGVVGTGVAAITFALKKHHEPRVAASAGLSDPLSPWLEYIKAIQDYIPSDQKEAFELLERCSRTFKDSEQYKDDRRYLRVWLEYAKNLSNSVDLFKFLYKKKIGVKHALFWMAWALVAESAGRYPLTDMVLTKGINRLAEPVQNLKKKRREFLRRMRRQYINHQLEEGVSEEHVQELPEDDKEYQALLQKLANIFAAQNGANPTATRRGLGNRQDAENTHPSGNNNNSNVGGVVGMEGGARQRGLGRRARSGTDGGDTGGNGRNVGGPGWVIFDEAEFEAGGQTARRGRGVAGSLFDDSGSDAASTWADYGTRESRDRENILKPSKWSDGALGERPGVRSAGSLGATASSGRSGGGTVRATVAAESYTIYSDEQDQGKEEQAVPQSQTEPREEEGVVGRSTSRNRPSKSQKGDQDGSGGTAAASTASAAAAAAPMASKQAAEVPAKPKDEDEQIEEARARHMFEQYARLEERQRTKEEEERRRLRKTSSERGAADVENKQSVPPSRPPARGDGDRRRGLTVTNAAAGVPASAAVVGGAAAVPESVDQNRPVGARDDAVGRSRRSAGLGVVQRTSQRRDEQEMQQVSSFAHVSSAGATGNERAATEGGGVNPREASDDDGDDHHPRSHGSDGGVGRESAPQRRLTFGDAVGWQQETDGPIASASEDPVRHEDAVVQGGQSGGVNSRRVTVAGFEARSSVFAEGSRAMRENADGENEGRKAQAHEPEVPAPRARAAMIPAVPPPVPSRPSRPVSRDIMAEDEEEMTINTRLAMQDMDSWFDTEAINDVGTVDQGPQGATELREPEPDQEPFEFFVDPDGSIADSIMREKESSRRQQPVFGDENGPPPAERCGADFAHQGFGGEGDENDENQENIGMPINLNARNVRDSGVEESVLQEREIPGLPPGAALYDEVEDYSEEDNDPNSSRPRDTRTRAFEAEAHSTSQNRPGNTIHGSGSSSSSSSINNGSRRRGLQPRVAATAATEPAGDDENYPDAVAAVSARSGMVSGTAADIGLARRGQVTDRGNVRRTRVTNGDYLRSLGISNLAKHDAGGRARNADPEIYQDLEPEIYQDRGPEVYQDPEPKIYQDPEPEIYQDPEPEIYQDPEPEIYQDPDPEIYQDPDPEIYQDPEPEIYQDSEPEIYQDENHEDMHRASGGGGKSGEHVVATLGAAVPARKHGDFAVFVDDDENLVDGDDDNRQFSAYKGVAAATAARRQGDTDGHHVQGGGLHGKLGKKMATGAVGGGGGGVSGLRGRLAAGQGRAQAGNSVLVGGSESGGGGADENGQPFTDFRGNSNSENADADARLTNANASDVLETESGAPASGDGRSSIERRKSSYGGYLNVDLSRIPEGDSSAELDVSSSLANFSVYGSGGGGGGELSGSYMLGECGDMLSYSGAPTPRGRSTSSTSSAGGMSVGRRVTAAGGRGGGSAASGSGGLRPRTPRAPVDENRAVFGKKQEDNTFATEAGTPMTAALPPAAGILGSQGSSSSCSSNAYAAPAAGTSSESIAVATPVTMGAASKRRLEEHGYRDFNNTGNSAISRRWECSTIKRSDRGTEERVRFGLSAASGESLFQNDDESDDIDSVDDVHGKNDHDEDSNPRRLTTGQSGSGSLASSRGARRSSSTLATPAVGIARDAERFDWLSMPESGSRDGPAPSDTDEVPVGSAASGARVRGAGKGSSMLWSYSSSSTCDSSPFCLLDDDRSSPPSRR